MEFGRGRKKLAAKNRLAPTKNRVRLRWGKTSRCRFLSHLDNIRVIETALRIADGIAIVSAICAAPDPESAAKELSSIISQVRKDRLK